MKQSAENKLSEIYFGQSELIGEGFDGWVNASRSDFLSGFMLGGIPSAGDERYRHSPVGGLFTEADYETYFVPQASLSQFETLSSDNFREIVVENGFCKTDCVQMENGVVYGSLRQAMEHYPELLQRYYNSVADNDGDTLTALSSAFMQDGAFIYVPQGVDAGGFVIDERYASQDAAQMCFSRTLIVLEDDARTEIAHVHRHGSVARFLIDGVREMSVGRGADMNFTEINMLSDNDSLIMGSYVRQSSDSRSESVLCDFGSGMARYNLRTDLDGEKAEAKLWGLYMASGCEHTDIAVNMRHNVPACKSDQLIKGIASDEATGVFSGLVYVASDAQHTDANQLNLNILMSQAARIYTEPQLEIYADDVKCSHGATVGQLDDDAVFYMRQRGISQKEARRLQIIGFVTDITSRCRCSFLCRMLEDMATAKIEKL